MNKENFIKEIEKLNINVTTKHLEKLNIYYDFLISENKKYNLTAITDESLVYLKHFYDSLTIAKYINFNNQSVLDIGSGAGFPGIVLKIFFEDIKLTIVESVNKKVLFLKELVNLLELKNVEVINDRAEFYTVKQKEEFDIITGRAVASSSIFLEISAQGLKEKGLIVLYKGELEKISDESLNELGLSFKESFEFKLPFENSNRSIIIYEKTFKTDDKYPREYKDIKKYPIV